MAATIGGSMNRRQVLSGVGFLATAAGTAEQARSQSSAGVANKALVATASDCVGKGQVCLSHCLDMLATGDKSMGACSKTVDEMLAVCGAMVSLAAQGAPSVSKFAAVCLDVCRRCEAECRKHAQHTPCKDCATACAACQVECKKIAA
jgi:Cys-rich four helix bundle protein (predicted Tat secretion target)